MSKSKNTIYVNNCGDGDSCQMYEMSTNNIDKVKMQYYKRSSYWSNNVRGKTTATLVDNSNNITINLKKNLPNKKNLSPITLDYDEVIELLLILRYYTEDSNITTFNNELMKFEEKK